MIAKEDTYELYGFTHHEFFFDYCDENLFSPDIVIFDWDIGPNSSDADSEKNLLKLLKSSYCIVAIFTGADKEDKVTKIIEKDDFKEFKDSRLFLIKKKSENSVAVLQAKIEKLKSDNFSFGLGRDLKKSTLQSVENILINIGKLSFDQFVTAFGHIDDTGQKRMLSKIDFTDLFVEKLQTELLNSEFGAFPLMANKKNVNDGLLLKKIWHYRLYHSPKDDILRKGDILRKAESEGLYLVLTSDCHLNQFWKKNLGHLILVPLHKADYEGIRKKIKLHNKSASIGAFGISSIVNPRGLENITIFPALHEVNVAETDEESGEKVIRKDFMDYILSPKETFAIDVPRPEGVESWMPLKSKHLIGYEGNGRLRITEPFLSPLTQYILSQVAGYGTPDFSDELQLILADNIKSIRNDKI